jgi:hypothetical protein
MNEEERAELYRSQTAARRQARTERYIGLAAGNRDARLALEVAWRPPLLAALEAQGMGDCGEFLEEMYVEIPQKDAYLTEIPEGLLI